MENMTRSCFARLVSLGFRCPSPPCKLMDMLQSLNVGYSQTREGAVFAEFKSVVIHTASTLGSRELSESC